MTPYLAETVSLFSILPLLPLYGLSSLTLHHPKELHPRLSNLTEDENLNTNWSTVLDPANRLVHLINQQIVKSVTE